jgi:hypothetical protein
MGKEIEEMTWFETEVLRQFYRTAYVYTPKDLFYRISQRQRELAKIDDERIHEVTYSKEAHSSRDSQGRWFCSCGALLTATSFPSDAMAIHMTELGR